VVRADLRRQEQQVQRVKEIPADQLYSLRLFTAAEVGVQAQQVHLRQEATEPQVRLQGHPLPTPVAVAVVLTGLQVLTDDRAVAEVEEQVV
jgi:hypothetical protein